MHFAHIPLGAMHPTQFPTSVTQIMSDKLSHIHTLSIIIFYALFTRQHIHFKLHMQNILQYELVVLQSAAYVNTHFTGFHLEIIAREGITRFRGFGWGQCTCRRQCVIQIAKFNGGHIIQGEQMPPPLLNKTLFFHMRQAKQGNRTSLLVVDNYTHNIKTVTCTVCQDKRKKFINGNLLVYFFSNMTHTRRLLIYVDLLTQGYSLLRV